MLRDYQEEMVARLQRAWKRYRSVMIQMPTGTGKTVLMAEVIREMCQQGEVLVVAHRRELIEQVKERMRKGEKVASPPTQFLRPVGSKRQSRALAGRGEWLPTTVEREESGEGLKCHAEIAESAEMTAFGSGHAECQNRETRDERFNGHTETTEITEMTAEGSLPCGLRVESVQKLAIVLGRDERGEARGERFNGHTDFELPANRGAAIARHPGQGGACYQRDARKQGDLKCHTDFELPAQRGAAIKQGDLKCHAESADNAEMTAEGSLPFGLRVESVQKLAMMLGREERGEASPPTPLAGRGEWLPTTVERVERGEARDEREEEWEEFEPKVVIVDEAHHAVAKTYRMLWERWPKAKFLGLTATPCRLSGEGFMDLFQTMLQGQSIQWFIDQGWLSDFEYISAAPDSEMLRQVASLQKRGADGDYQTKEMVTVMDVPESIAHLYRTYEQFAGGKKGIVYAIDRQHAGHIADYYTKNGVCCAVIDAKTPAKERQQLVEDYREGRLDVLVNVDIFSEGFDCPEVEFIQLARPTLSLSKYLQQVGRGMRVSAGKPHVLILDNVGLYQTFGLPTEERDWRGMFQGRMAGKGERGQSRYVVLDERGQEKELVNLQMVRIKKGDRKRSGLEIFLKDGHYGIINGGRITCPARFKRIVRMEKESGFFAAGIYGGLLAGRYVEYASLIDRKGTDRDLKLYRDVEWKDGYFFSSYERQGEEYVKYWDPKGDCYYDYDPEFQTVSGVEVGISHEHTNDTICFKLRCSTGKVSPRFYFWDIYYNKDIIIARDYLIVKTDHNHAYHICGYQEDSVIVQDDRPYEFLQIFPDGRKGKRLARLPKDMNRVTMPGELGLEKVKS